MVDQVVTRVSHRCRSVRRGCAQPPRRATAELDGPHSTEEDGMTWCHRRHCNWTSGTATVMNTQNSTACRDRGKACTERHQRRTYTHIPGRRGLQPLQPHAHSLLVPLLLVPSCLLDSSRCEGSHSADH